MTLSLINVISAEPLSTGLLAKQKTKTKTVPKKGAFYYNPDVPTK
jgi:hypothetical protein